MINTYKDKVNINDLCIWLSYSRSSCYYKPKTGKRGCKPSSFTKKQSGEIVSNEVVIEEIRDILKGEFVCYGYQTTSHELKERGYWINTKKVYRLMNENNLLLGKVIKTTGKRNFVRHRKIEAVKPMEYLSLDIKYIYVNNPGKNYYLLSIIDVYSRRILDWIFQPSIKQIDVLKMLSRVHQTYGIKGVFIRNDNGSQFIANKVKSYLLSIEAYQEFTHIATPEENAYIEAFHSIFQREVMDRFEMEDFVTTKLTVEAYMMFYNQRRKHRNLGLITPMQKWEQYYSLSTIRQLAELTNISSARFSEENFSSIEKINDLEKISLETKPDLEEDISAAYICPNGEDESKININLLNQNLNSV